MQIKDIANSIKSLFSKITNLAFKIEDLEKKEIVLYTGNTTSSATLSQNIANFKIVKIYYIDTDNFKNCVEIFNNNNNEARTGLVNCNNIGRMYMKSARCIISQNVLTLDRQYESVLNTNGSTNITTSTVITVEAVTGIK